MTIVSRTTPTAPNPHPNPLPAQRARESRFLALPVWIIILICSGLPLGWLLLQFLGSPRVLADAWPDAFRLQLLGRTLLYNGCAALAAAAIGLPVGIVLGRGRGIIARLFWVLLPVSLLLPSLAYTYGWSQFFRLLDLHPLPASPADVARCAWSLATWLWPIPAACVGIALRRTDAQLQLQALLDGALWRVTFRALAPPIAAGVVIAFVLAVQEFAVYEPTGISVVATEVRMVFETGAFSSADNPITAPMAGGQADVMGPIDQRARAASAVAVSLPLLLVIALVSIPVLLAGQKLAATEAIDAGPWPRVLDAGWSMTLLALACVVTCVIVPAASLLLSLRVWRGPVEVWHEFSPQALGSLLIALLAGLAACGLALWLCVRDARLPLALALVTFLLGGQLIAIALIRIYNRSALDWIYNAPPVVVMAYVARFGWVALVAGRTTWSPRWRTVRDLAAVDGAGAIEAARHVVWPLAWPLLLAAGVLVMALSLTEVPAAILLSPQRPPMLTPMLMTWVHMLRYDAMIEASLLLMSIVALLGAAVAALVWAQGKRRNEKGKTLASLAFFVFLPYSLFVLSTGCDHSQPKAIWLDTGTAPGQVVYPRAIAYKPQDDTFFVVDRMARIQQLDQKGKCLNEWRMPDWKSGKPVGVSVGPDGNVYVPDTHYQRVMVYTPSGELLRQWGSFGREAGQFIYPTDIAFDRAGNVFVAEYGDNDRIQVFTPQGKFLYAFGSFGKAAGQFMRPQSIVIDGDTLYAADSCNHRIAVFKTDGTFVRVMGSVGSGLGEFRYPYGLDQDANGHLIVCEFGNNRVQLIDKATGRGIKTWGTGGHDPGQLAYPWAVAVDKNDRVVTVDAGNNRLQVFEF